MDILSHKRCMIGEGPIWNVFDEKLYHVNCYTKELLIIDIDTKEVTTRTLTCNVSAIAFSKAGDMLISTDDGAYFLHPDNTRTPLYDTAQHQITFGNDAKVGPDGRFYVGTQCSKRRGVGEAVDGKLYSIDKNGNVTVLLDGLILSNGMDWSMDEKFFYHTDSTTEIIKEYAFDKETGSISFTGRQITIPGVDGFTIGQDHCLYAACWGRGHIAVVDTADMQIKTYIGVPAKIPASCCFAGKNMDQLVVVSATRGADTEVDVNAGYTFICNTSTKGRKPYLFG